LAVEPAPNPTSANPEPPTVLANDPETLILRAVKGDPFASIRELREEIARQNPRVELGWWQIFGILRRNRLLGRRARFRFARSRS